MKFPKQLLLTVTHGGFDIPDDFRHRLALEMGYNDYRLLKNFSDFGTMSLVAKSIPENQVIKATFSRALGDPNRSADADDLFRETDFNGVRVWKTPLTRHEKDLLIDQFYSVYHNSIQEKVDTGKFDLLIDIHDTGNRMLAPLKQDDSDRTPTFPQICISNGEGETCSEELLEAFAELLTKHTGFDVKLNDPYKGGFLVRHYGQQIQTMQVEFGRFLYMDETTQEIDETKAKHLRDGFAKALIELNNYL